ncbi:unnamed protein product [Thlaspi arvense]|uniref:Uncharacterized protein n=1 Tax=Thlaspi arvense TaxID=13288 RepID=A0AAU9R9Y5_THLAR|nr:unnamed protein product [Thlaspi arvense]
MEMKYTFQSRRCALCLPTAVYWSLKEPIMLRLSSSLACLSSFRQLELKTAASVRSLHNVFEIHSKEVNPSVFEVNSMEKDAEAESSSIVVSEDNRKVRKKMSEHGQPHSDETKEKLRALGKQAWVVRSRLKRLKDKLTSLWSENIAEAARKGGSGQVELDWDGYENAKQEILSEKLRLAEEKARTKEQTKVRAEEAAQARTEKMRRVAERTKVRAEEAAQARTEKMRRVAERKKEREERERKKEREERDRREGKIRKPKKNKECATITSCLKLKKRLAKIHKKKKSPGKIAVGKDRLVLVAAKLEKLDLEFIRKERTRGNISLADQIQAAKSLRGKYCFIKIWSFCNEINGF